MSSSQTIATFQHKISQYCRLNICKLRHKQSRRFSITYRNIVGRNKLCAIGHPIATCCDMLGIENRTSAGSCPGATLLHEPGQTTTTSCNIHKCCIKTLASLKFEPTTPNMSQHFETRYNMVAKRTQHVAPNNVAICCVEILL